MIAPILESSLDISRVPAGFPVGFCLFTAPPRQYVAYYDAERRMTVAARKLDEAEWQYQVLPTSVGWDSHNYVTMTADAEGYLHLSGNLHCDPLIYFRTDEPWDIKTFRQITAMTGELENRCTYPHFMSGKDGQLLFHYRDGGSGNGSEIYNRYDLQTRTWQRLLDTPLTDGKGQMNAYFHGPVTGPDGMFHLCWVWRDTPDCATNHDLSYARSADMRHWEAADGTPVSLPMTLDDRFLIVDPIPSHGGTINGAASIGFDSAGTLLISYYKFDDAGMTQAYIARFDNGVWRSHLITDWDYRWEMDGAGAVNSEIRLGPPRPNGSGQLMVPYHHSQYGKGQLVVDEASLAPQGRMPLPESYPPELVEPASRFPGMQVRWGGDTGRSEDACCKYVLRWETLPANRDKPRQPPLPDPSALRLLRIRKSTKPHDDAASSVPAK